MLNETLNGRNSQITYQNQSDLWCYENTRKRCLHKCRWPLSTLQAESTQNIQHCLEIFFLRWIKSYQCGFTMVWSICLFHGTINRARRELLLFLFFVASQGLWITSVMAVGNNPFPSAMLMHRRIWENWNFYIVLWANCEVAVMVDNKNLAIRVVTVNTVVSKSCFPIFQHLEIAL